jgi:hypothetical protein
MYFEKLSAGTTKITLQSTGPNSIGCTSLGVAGQFTAFVTFLPTVLPKWWPVTQSTSLIVVASGSVVPYANNAQLGTPTWSLIWNGTAINTYTLFFTATGTTTGGGGTFASWLTSVIVPY